MKTVRYIWTLCLTLAACTFTACSDDDDNGAGAEMRIDKIFLQDASSSATVHDREVDFARLGQMIRIQGTGFTGLKKIYINGFETYFNNALLTDNNVWVTLNSKTPVDKADPEVRNTIVFVKGNTSVTYEFTIRAASPSVTHIGNTLPQPGEIVKVYGASLHETTKVILPGGIEVTEEIINDPDGEFYAFKMPEGVTECGSITSEGANGTAVTPDNFNDARTVIINFDGVGEHNFWNWSETGSMINNEDLVDDPLNSGRGKVYQVIPQRLIDAGGVVAGKSRATECWATNLPDLSAIPATTPVTELAYQFEVYVPQKWEGTGHIQITLANNINWSGWGSDETKSETNITYVWAPWLNADGSTTPFITSGWQTITIPLAEFSRFAKEIAKNQVPTFQEVIDVHAACQYTQVGLGFTNTDVTVGDVEIPAVRCSQLIYIDSPRLVFNRSTIVSDF